MEIEKNKLPKIADEELKEIMLPTDKLVEIALNDFDEQLRSDEMKEIPEYKLQDLDELYGYMWLKPDVTNINADIFVDDGEAYIRDNHVPLLYVRNGSGREITEFIPISISELPTILDKDMVIMIDSNMIEQIIEFIKVNAKTLMTLANGKVNTEIFVSALKYGKE